ncbi:phenoloxidase 2-like [Hetaerina americana]|uniref:phenoloxidase 2-like n=1 Tax=Hetaerina americana TaxID=62018 RepID=UPI003A7F5BC2
MKVTPQHHVIHILCRPTEPCFVPKGQMRLAFDVLNNNFLAPQFQDAGMELEERYSKEKRTLVPLKEIDFPDLSGPMEIGREDTFCIFITHHQRMTEKLLNIFISSSEYDDFLSAAVYARDRVNPVMFVLAYSIAVLHRPDTKGLQLPPLHDIFPDKFLDGNIISAAREQANVLTAGESSVVIPPNDSTASDLDPEQRVAYFREDIGINLHHWQWHLVYPFFGPMEIVNKDRRGELFYYMNRQIVARYDNERLCNHLGRVKRLMDFKKPIPEGYFPKLYCSVAGRTWASRCSGATLSNVKREMLNIVYDLDDLERWKSRLIEAIHLKRVIDVKGTIVPLTGTDGIDILGDMVESSKLLSKDYTYYGDLHNKGHVSIALCHDPDGRYEETFGVMGDTATAMRDPVFYRWHSYIDHIFEMHKNTLQPYQHSELDFRGISVEAISVQAKGNPKENILKTFWEERKIALTSGLDFTDHMPIHARITRLQHRPFSYKIQVMNQTKKICKGTVRIYLAPKYDEGGRPMLFIDQKRLFMELDKFQVLLFPSPQLNVIERESKDSYVTKKVEKSLEEIEKELMETENANRKPFVDVCGCGWPHNMLIPKGSIEGFQCQLFVMVSDAEEDLVDVDGSYSKGSSYCGVRDKVYPDRRPMGYPFDRLPEDDHDTLEKFVNRSSNMAVQDVKIVFEDRAEPTH